MPRRPTATGSISNYFPMGNQIRDPHCLYGGAVSWIYLGYILDGKKTIESRFSKPLIPPSDMKAIICLSGGIASGKSTATQTLTQCFSNVAVRSFGDVVRDHARSQGKPLDRSTLQAVGLTPVEAGWQAFIDALLEDVPTSADVLIVDGIRHLEAIEELRRRHLSDRFLTVCTETRAPRT